MEYTFCARAGKVYDPEELNKKYGVDQDLPKDFRFQEDTIYFREEKEKRIEYWDEKDKVSNILEEFLNLYDFKALTLDIKKTRTFIETYGMPLYSHKAGDNTFLGIAFAVEYMSQDPRFYFDYLPKKGLTDFYFFLRSIANLVDERLDDKNMDIGKRQCYRFSNMLYLLISPFMEVYVGGDIADNHIQEINKKKVFSSNDNNSGIRIFRMTESYEEELKKRKEDYWKANKKEKETTNIGGECSAEAMFATTNVVDYKEKIKRVDLILKFLQVVKKTYFYFNIDNQGCLINIDDYNEEFVDLCEEDGGIIEEIVPLFIKDYLDYLIQGYSQVVIKGSQGYELGMQLDTMGAILFGLLYTLDSKKYIRKCPNCGQFFYPSRNHPKQRSCGQKCSGILHKRRIRAKEIEGIPYGSLAKVSSSSNHL